MSFQIIYKKILTLEVWHDYYIGQPLQPTLPEDYDISDLFTLVPTSDCSQTLKNLQWVYRSQPAGGDIFANVNQVGADDFATQVKIDSPYRLTFWLMVNNPYLTNFTNLPLITKLNPIYHFSNLSKNSIKVWSQNQENQQLCLSQPLPNYDPEKEAYSLGQLINHQGKIREAIKAIKPVPSTLEEEDWQTIEPTSQYVSELDQQIWQPGSQTRRLPNLQANQEFLLELKDINEQTTFILEDKVPETHPSGKHLTINLNFREQPPGLYQLTLNGNKIDEFVLINPLKAQKAWGLVEIVLNPNLESQQFSFLDYQEQQTLIRPQTYVIRLKNRGTRWRYHHSKPHGFEDSNPNSDTLLEQFLENFNIPNKTTYETKKPVGLRLEPSEFFKDGKGKLLPVPGVSLIKPERDKTNQHISKIFSDIYL